jgi:hypothetical protein
MPVYYRLTLPVVDEDELAARVPSELLARQRHDSAAASPRSINTDQPQNSDNAPLSVCGNCPACGIQRQSKFRTIALKLKQRD